MLEDVEWYQEHFGIPYDLAAVIRDCEGVIPVQQDEVTQAVVDGPVAVQHLIAQLEELMEEAEYVGF